MKVTVTDGKVTAATITGDKETETIGGAAIKTLTEKLIGVSSADEVDAVASATVTSNAVKTALADCLRQAAGEEKTETALVDGVYTGEGRGFNLTQKVQVTVEIKDGKIGDPVKIAVITGNVFETLAAIDGVANDKQLLSFVTGGCGKMEQFPLNVGLGGPHVRVKEMNVQ